MIGNFVAMKEIKTKEIAAYVASHVEDYEIRLSLALGRLGKWRCPLRMADDSLFDEIVDAIEEWFDDNDISIDYDFDFEEMIEGEEDGIIWEC